ncbi:MAG: DNA-3-methyladenine glycosylase 2 family protein, partial [Atopobiaceae bacterium]|nr:DNA-3-methyladenine glycosylase 2 family protein [Atopobiaceae bacterium]
MLFEYGQEAIEHLSAKDPELAEVIDQVGIIERSLDDDLFPSVVHHIIGQQISSKAQHAIWLRAKEALGEPTPQALDAASIEELQAVGISFRKAEYIKGFAHEVATGAFDLEAIRTMDDAEAIRALSSIRGIGVWTAEMLLLFSLGRQDILSFDDLG